MCRKDLQEPPDDQLPPLCLPGVASSIPIQHRKCFWTGDDYVPFSGYAAFPEQCNRIEQSGNGRIYSESPFCCWRWFVLTLQSQNRISAIASANFSSGNPALKDAQFALGFPIPAWIIYDFVIAGCEEVMNTHIDPHGFPGGWKGLLIYFTGKAGIPFPGLSAYANSLDLPFDGAMPANT